MLMSSLYTLWELRGEDPDQQQLNCFTLSSPLLTAQIQSYTDRAGSTKHLQQEQGDSNKRCQNTPSKQTHCFLSMPKTVKHIYELKQIFAEC